LVESPVEARYIGTPRPRVMAPIRPGRRHELDLGGEVWNERADLTQDLAMEE
jgi:hypothetical protein